MNKSNRKICGWEYMDLMQEKHLRTKHTPLSGAGGLWKHYARDIRSLVLFGSNIEDIMKAAPLIQPGQPCSACLTLPRDECFLAVKVSTLNDLFEAQGSLKDQERLTASGLTLAGCPDPLKPCETNNDLNKGHVCIDKKVVRLANRSWGYKAKYGPKMAAGKISLPPRSTGAVILG